mmetsp:Transcript_28562/g.53708  ORF Transcript_28562/g.53708 Transcript_28562/m.53708 type:complete len:752 (-) Transcript_28562:574-2829(-)
MPAGQFLGTCINLERQFGRPTRQFRIGNDRAGERDGTDPDAQHQFHAQNANLDRRLLGNQLTKGRQTVIDLFGQPDGFDAIRAHGTHHKALGLIDATDIVDHQIGVKADKDRRQTNKRVHDGHKLGHLRHLDLGGQLIANGRTAREQDQRGEPEARTGAHKRRQNGDAHAHDAVPHGPLGAFLPRKAAQRQDEKDGCDHIGRDGECVFHSPRPVLRFLEHGEHPPCHEEAAKDVDGGHKDPQSTQQRNERACRSDLDQRAQNDDRRDRVGHRHQRRVQRMRHVPDDLEADEHAQHKDDEMLHEAGRHARDQPDAQHQSATNAQQGDLIAGLRLERRVLNGPLFFGRQLFGRFLFRSGCNGGHFGRWRREGDLVAMGNGCATDHVIFHVVVDNTVFFRRQIRHQVTDVGGVEAGGLRRHPAWEIGIADDGHAILSHDLLVHHGQLTVAAFFRCQIDNHRTRLHRRNHVLGPQLGRFAVGDQGRGDDDVDLRRQFAELGKLGFAEFGRGNRGIAAGCGPICLLLFEIEVHKLGAHGFDLLGHFGAHVKSIGDRTKRGRCADRGETRNTRADNQNLGRGHLARRRDLTGKEAAKIVARLNHRTVARDIGHGGQGVHLLGAADAWDHLHRDNSGALFGGLAHLVFVRDGAEERDQGLVFAQALHLGGIRRTDLGDHIGGLPKGSGGLDHLDARSLVGRIVKSGLLAGPRLNHTVVAQLLQGGGAFGRHGNAALSGKCLFWCSDLHGNRSPVFIKS